MLVYVVGEPGATVAEGREAIAVFCAVMQAWVYAHGPQPANVEWEIRVG